ncbi:hypothetical protein I546_1249 [Mycobacterium kansasii 732]|nr:hypothetical protein I546_1249 [Mycobacterium kansasii 732]
MDPPRRHPRQALLPATMMLTVANGCRGVTGSGSADPDRSPAQHPA